MGMMDKLAFWKKDDIPNDDFSKDPFDNGQDISDPQQVNNPFLDDKNEPDPLSVHPDFNPSKPFEAKQSPQPQQSNVNSELLNKNIELVSTKIDSLKAELESMNQRLMNIENMARKEEGPVRRYTPRW